jgi:hypothetical protein
MPVSATGVAIVIGASCFRRDVVPTQLDEGEGINLFGSGDNRSRHSHGGYPVPATGSSPKHPTS